MLVALAAAAASCGDGGSSAGVPTITGAAAKRGQAVAEANGCQNCHNPGGGRATGPTWKDMAGSEVELEGGEVVVADDDYLERAILDPRSEVVDGFPNIMPIYADELSDEQVADLIAYLRELSTKTRGAATTTSTTSP
jgi:cytochrome c oxidase subunit 2